MGRRVHTVRVTIHQEPERIRRAYLEGFEEPLVFGVHGGVKEFYGVEPKEERPTTIDHLVAALAG
ncbi:MAG TPA: hypothetical protein VIN09_10755 [Chloroflexota bacterium]|jgi:hypothetical protein